MMSAAPGQLDHAKADTKPSIRNWARSKISSACLSRAKQLGLEVALDLAYQCAPDHPYVKEHEEWFRMRPDGSVQYAENPPKKYQDIFPLDFETDQSQALWEELRSVVLYWIEQGVRIFRVDNPHTKPFDFWEWLISDIKGRYPDVLFLAEAFTRPKLMYELAKLGFTQSYTYFAWRNTKPEITEYFKELTQTEVREYFRPNLWPNTPDILTDFLQHGGRPAFMSAWCWRQLWARITGSTVRLSSSAKIAPWLRAAKSISTRRNIRFAPGTWKVPTAWRN